MCLLAAILVFAAFSVTNFVHGYELSSLGDFDQQVNELLQYQKLSDAEVHNMSRAAVDVETALQTRWPGSKAFLFGSIITGLATRSSDVDIYIALPNQTIHPDGGIVVEAEKVFMKQPALFKDFVTKPTRRVPVISFVYVPTGRYCDVSFSGPSAVQYSKLVAYYLKLDKRIMDVALLLKLWARIHRVSRDMPSYGMSLLVIFYFQQRNLVPPIYRLQPKNHTLIEEDHWNTYFDPIIYHSMNNESLYQLLGGFFLYYSTFDFGEYIVSPYAGRVINRKLFESVDSVPHEFSLYKYVVWNNLTLPLKSGIVTIQDPFIHNENVGGRITQYLAVRMHSLFTRAYEIYETKSSDKFLRLLFDERTNEK